MSVPHTRHVPLRRCVACRASLPQAALTRLYQDAEGRWQVDVRKRAGGRGAWVCGETECRSPRKLGRFFRGQARDVAQLLETAATGAVAMHGGTNE